MTITSPEFAAFTLVVLLIYYGLARREQNILLLVASYVFLGTWELQFAGMFAILSATNYWLGQWATPHDPRRRYALWSGIGINVLALGFLKYHNFFLPDSFSDGIKILLPIGLSFYVVQAISYLMDINKGLIEPEKNPIHFALYMSYFPRVTSGPIERAREFIPKLEEKRSLSYDGFSRSFTLLLVGLVRKIALADVLFVILPKDVFRDPQHYTAPQLIIWLLAYAFALYNDFAGYTQIVRGVSGFFGIELSENFNVPYFARNFTEFWQRWHITLSNWLRDYIFTPTLRGLLRRKYNSRHALTIIIPPLLTMFVSALWHDVSPSMILWGMMHGVYQVFERVRAVWRPSPPPQNHPWWRQVAAMILVFVLAVIAWVPFRANFGDTFDYWGGLLDWSHPDIDLLFHLHVLVYILIAGTLILDLIHYRLGEFAYLRLPSLGKAILINVAIIAIILGLAAQGDAPPPFVYQGF